MRASAMPDESGAGPTGRSLVWLVFAVFFIWGGATSLNDVLIPKLKGLFALTYAEAMLTQFAFFGAYFLFSIPAGQMVARVGYVRGLVIGLAVMAAGALLFWPAGLSGAYWPFLIALFVLAAGITVLQVAANPLIATLGRADGASSRLTFAQAFNSLGTTIWPYIGAQLILGSVAAAPAPTEAAQAAAFRSAETAIVGLGGQAFMARNSQDAVAQFRPYFDNAPVYGHGPSLEDFSEMTPLTVGSPQQVIDRYAGMRELFGDYQRQLFLMDHAGLPLKTVLEQLDFLGGEVVPVLRREFAKDRPAAVPDAPTHAARVKAVYGDGPARQATPRANRGDNLSGPSPYQDAPAPAGAAFGVAGGRCPFES